jgi:uncharacterized membrane protein
MSEEEPIREKISKKIGTAVIVVTVGVIVLAQILPEIFGVTLPITKLFPRFPDARTALIGFVLGLWAFVAFPPLFGIQFANLGPKLPKTWADAILSTLLSLSILSYVLIVVFLFYVHNVLEKFHYPVFSGTVLYFIIFGYPTVLGYIMGFVYEPVAKIVSKVRKYLGYKRSEKGTLDQ